MSTTDNEHITPPSVIEELIKDPPMCGVVAEPAAGTGALPSVPEMTPTDWLDLPRGVKLQRFVAADRAVTFMGQYINRDGKPNDAPCRLYRVEVRPMAPLESGWCVSIFEDNHRFWSGKANTSRYCAEYTAVKMLKCYLKVKCRNADKRRRRRERKASEGGDNAEAQP